MRQKEGAAFDQVCLPHFGGTGRSNIDRGKMTSGPLILSQNQPAATHEAMLVAVLPVLATSAAAATTPQPLLFLPQSAAYAKCVGQKNRSREN